MPGHSSSASWRCFNLDTVFVLTICGQSFKRTTLQVYCVNRALVAVWGNWIWRQKCFSPAVESPQTGLSRKSTSPTLRACRITNNEVQLACWHAFTLVEYHYCFIGDDVPTRRQCSFRLNCDNSGTIMCEWTKAHMVSFHDSCLSLSSHPNAIALLAA